MNDENTSLTLGEQKYLEKQSGCSMLAIKRVFEAIQDDSIPLNTLPEQIVPIQIAMAVVYGRRKYGHQNFTVADAEKLTDEEWLDLCGLNSDETEVEAESKNN